MSFINSISEEELNLLIEKYVKAEDIEEYDIDELENDVLFMMRVIMKTNDKNMYYMCSDEVNTDFSFFKFLIDRFKGDQEFVDEVILHFYSISDDEKKLNYDFLNYSLENISEKTELRDEIDYFLVNSEDEVSVLELAINLSKDKENFSDCIIIANAKIIAKLVDFAIEIDKIEDEEIKMAAGLGFCLVGENYNYNETIMNAFAKTFLNMIFYECELNIEQLLHKSFTSKEAIEKRGLNAFITDYLRSKDDALAEYVFARKELIQPVLKDFNFAFKNWDNFEKKNIKDRISIIYEEAKKYTENNGKGIRFSYLDAVYFVAKELHVEADFDAYNLELYKDYIGSTYQDDYDNFIKEMYESDLVLINNYVDDFNLAEIAYLNFLRNLTKKMYKDRITFEVSDSYIAPEVKNTEFIEFPSSGTRR